MVYSATSAAAAVGGKDPNYYLKRQGIYAAFGIVLMLVAAALGLPPAEAARAGARARLARAAGRRARHRPRDQRRPAVDLARTCRFPAFRAREALARGVGGRVLLEAPGAARPETALASGRCADGGLLRAPHSRAGHGHRDRAARDARRGAPRGRHAGADARRRDRDRRRTRHRARSGSSRIAARASSLSCTRGTTHREPASRSSRR